MWAGGGLSIDEGPLEALRAWGADEKVVDDWRKSLQRQARENGVEIWPQHWHAWQVFIGMRTQWRVAAGFGGLVYFGLDYAALDHVLRELADSEHAQPHAILMPQLRILEEAARDELNA